MDSQVEEALKLLYASSEFKGLPFILLSLLSIKKHDMNGHSQEA